MCIFLMLTALFAGLWSNLPALAFLVYVSLVLCLMCVALGGACRAEDDEEGLCPTTCACVCCLVAVVVVCSVYVSAPAFTLYTPYREGYTGLDKANISLCLRWNALPDVSRGMCDKVPLLYPYYSTLMVPLWYTYSTLIVPL
jgi:hypothetical protein